MQPSRQGGPSLPRLSTCAPEWAVRALLRPCDHGRDGCEGPQETRDTNRRKRPPESTPTGHMTSDRTAGFSGSPRQVSSSAPVSSLREVLHDARRLPELVRLACPLIPLNDRRAHATSRRSPVAATNNAETAAKPPTTCATRPRRAHTTEWPARPAKALDALASSAVGADGAAHTKREHRLRKLALLCTSQAEPRGRARGTGRARAHVRGRTHRRARARRRRTGGVRQDTDRPCKVAGRQMINASSGWHETEEAAQVANACASRHAHAGVHVCAVCARARMREG